VASDDGRMDALERNAEGGCGQKCDREHAHFLAQSFAEARMMCKSAVAHEICNHASSSTIEKQTGRQGRHAQALSRRLRSGTGVALVYVTEESSPGVMLAAGCGAWGEPRPHVHFVLYLSHAKPSPKDPRQKTSRN